MKSILVIGMGRFGRNLALKMQELGNDVMIVDKNEAIINELSPSFTNALIGDATNLGVLRSLGVNNFDICFVTMGDNFQSSLEITSQLKDLGAKFVVSKASRDLQAKFLTKCGADEVVYPERDMAERLAIRFNSKNVFDYVEVNSEFGIFEIAVPKKWVGNTVFNTKARQQYNVNIIAVKKGDVLKMLTGADYVFGEEDHLMVIGKSEDIFKLTNKA